MLDSVYEYFRQKSDVEKDQRVQRTRAAPIYFQHQGTTAPSHKGATLIVFRPFNDDCWSREQTGWRQGTHCIRSSSPGCVHNQGFGWHFTTPAPYDIFKAPTTLSLYFQISQQVQRIRAPLVSVLDPKLLKFAWEFT
jgi:hypothetical protein